MYDQEHIEFYQGIRGGNPINNGVEGAHSTLMSIMGRMATYTGPEDHLGHGDEVEGGPVAAEVRVGAAQVRPGGGAGDDEVHVIADRWDGSMVDAVAKYVSYYRSIGLTGSPFTPDEIVALERHLGLSLPAAYRAYLSIAGASPPPKLVGSDCHGHRLYELRDGAEQLLRDCGHPFELPSDAAVYFMHQGYQFLYFRSDDRDDDPPVDYFIEGMTSLYAPERRFERFSDWVAVCV